VFKLLSRVESGGRELLVKSFKQCWSDSFQKTRRLTQPSHHGRPSGDRCFKIRPVSLNCGNFFASSKTVQHFTSIGPVSDRFSLACDFEKIFVLCRSVPKRQKTCQELFGRAIDVEATEYTLEGLVDGIVRSVQL
jgi:hypothetical protein